MQSEPTKLVFAGLVVGVVAIGAAVSQSGRQWLSGDEPGSARDEAISGQMRADTMSGTVTQAPVVARGTVAGNLLAARDSLERNDLAGAQAQLNAVQPGFRDDDRVIALKRELAARVEQAQRESVAAQASADKPAPVAGAKMNREDVTRKVASSSSSGLSSSSVSSSSHRSGRAAAHGANRRERVDVATNGASKAVAASTVSSPALIANAATQANAPGALPPKLPPLIPARSLTSGPVTQAAVQSAEPAQTTVQALGQTTAQATTQTSAQATTQTTTQATTPPAPSSPRTELTAQTTQQPPLTQNARAASLMPQADAGPKTRAEVRAEIARARSDGDLPAFGNPDPAGPGGAPSMTIQPRP